MTTNRVEFPIAVHAISKLGAAAVLLSPAWKAAEVDHALSLTGPVHAVADGPAVELLAERLGADASPTSTQLSLDARRRRRSPPTTSARTTRRSSCSAPAPPVCPKAVRHTHRSIGAGHRPLGAGPRPHRRRPLPGGHAAVAHPRAAQPPRRRRGRRHACACTAGSTSTRCCVASSPTASPSRWRWPPSRWPWPATPTSRSSTSRRSATSCGAPRRSPRAWPRPSPRAPACAGCRPTAPASCR